ILFLAYSAHYSNYTPIPQFGSPFTDSTVLLLHLYSLSSCNRALLFFRFLQRPTNNSGKGGNLFLPSSSFILSDVSLPLITE
ncbi:hypothetical protein Gogos_021780, partial [Gossypium gossypioides]|nr:hypothetical protein [Gossypium gossypioides]